MATNSKNDVLLSLAKLIEKSREDIIKNNVIDLNSVSDEDISMKDRLKVDNAKIEGMIKSLHDVALQSDPEGRVLYDYTRPDGLHIVNKTVPFGTILIIYESRPDVTVEAAATAFKAGNKILLKGGRESLNTNLCLTKLWHEALHQNGFDTRLVQYLDISRQETQDLIKNNNRNIDLIIPRGGEALIEFVVNNSSVPVIISGRGNNFIYVDDECSVDLAAQLIINGKQRISVCNAIDKVLINKNIADLSNVVETFVDALNNCGVEVYSDSETSTINKNIVADDNQEVMYEEFLAPKMFFSIVENIDQAIETINKYSGGHSAVIATNNKEKAYKFMLEVDCAAVYHNASSRFTDGGQFGVGAEIAISTQKIHFRGPLGAQELVTNKWFVYGEGHVRDQQPSASTSCNNA